ncbi:MAG: glutamyl-tRNA reductase, partial [Saccharothrix sp.]|nr:glutamyl-tRNA reductase [Saccharothrix sp.]
MTELLALSISGRSAPIRLLERLSVSPAELAGHLADLRPRAGVQVALLSTCQRVELYAVGSQDLDHDRLLSALAGHRGVALGELAAAARTFSGEYAVRHLCRVTAGLESFVLGENEIAGQVRAAGQASRDAGTSGAELNRLFETAAGAARAVKARTTFGRTRQSVGAAAVDWVASRFDGDLTGRRLLVVGAGQVATVAGARAGALGARVTVANRSRGRAESIAVGDVRVVDLAALDDQLATSDAVVVATAASQPLIDATSVRGAGPDRAGPLLLVDVSLPRNVHPSVRAVPAVELVDLADLRRWGPRDTEVFTADVRAAVDAVEEHVDRYQRWLATHGATAAVNRLRADAEEVAEREIRRVLRRLPGEQHDMVRQALTRISHRLAHGPTVALRAAAERGDDSLVALLSGLFGDPTDRSAADAHAAGALRRTALGPQRGQLRALEDAA